MNKLEIEIDMQKLNEKVNEKKIKIIMKILFIDNKINWFKRPKSHVIKWYKLTRKDITK